MFNVININKNSIYLCEIFEQACEAYYITYGEQPSKFIVSPLIYKELEFEYGGNEPLEFMGCDIVIDEKVKNNLIYII
jgi:hypothetical protein